MRTMKDKFRLELGIKVKDSITDFSGVITGCTRYITGCDIYLLQPPIDKEGKHVDAKWYDDIRLDKVKAKSKKLKDSENGGACEPAPIK